jgi:hypothetical protein
MVSASVVVLLGSCKRTAEEELPGEYLLLVLSTAFHIFAHVLLRSIVKGAGQLA